MGCDLIVMSLFLTPLSFLISSKQQLLYVSKIWPKILNNRVQHNIVLWTRFHSFLNCWYHTWTWHCRMWLTKFYKSSTFIHSFCLNVFDVTQIIWIIRPVAIIWQWQRYHFSWYDSNKKTQREWKKFQHFYSHRDLDDDSHINSYQGNYTHFGHLVTDFGRFLTYGKLSLGATFNYEFCCCCEHSR